jgi:alpha-ketoglutarate-dependent taurine dioxygenase
MEEGALKEEEEAGAVQFAPARRKAVRVSPSALVRAGFLEEAPGWPRLIEPGAEGVELAGWARANREAVGRELAAHGAVLFRGFGVESAQGFEQFARAVSPDLLDYLERAAPRAEVEKNIYTSTEYPADQSIPLHHEMSYSHNWPTKIMFFCLQPAQQGGATPICDDRKVIGLIDPSVKEHFMRKKVMYVRNYGEGLDLSWREAFQTADRREVEEYCRHARMTCEWGDGDRLRTRAVRQVVATHPSTGETLWFNHAHMFHISNVEPGVREALLSQFAEDELPRNAFYGDGSTIEDSVLEEIRGVYERTAVRFDWRKGDVLLLDNFLSSHGRDPFAGPRKVLVAMSELYTSDVA